jgi:hypothetical protein
MFPDSKKKMEDDVCLYTLLIKRCVQASTLWYALYRSELESLGYEVRPTDPCIFMKEVGSRVFVLLLYVDDILAFFNAEEA